MAELVGNGEGSTKSIILYNRTAFPWIADSSHFSQPQCSTTCEIAVAAQVLPTTHCLISETSRPDTCFFSIINLNNTPSLTIYLFKINTLLNLINMQSINNKLMQKKNKN
jgi:hypothetical protein